MKRPIRILLQTTIAHNPDDWSIERFSLLERTLASLRDENGNPVAEVTARNRQSGADGNDPVLSTLHTSGFDELWLFAVDIGDGLTRAECSAITEFHERGGGVLTTRDHEDLGVSLWTLGGIGAAHYFHTQNPEPDSSRHAIDDPYSSSISWPNYHSGANGDYQKVRPLEEPHELLRNPDSESGLIEFLPAHPHEGAVGVPVQESRARVIATGASRVTGRPFNLMVAFERESNGEGAHRGRAVAQSSFHHFVDYNWDPSLGCPSFVAEPPGTGMLREPRALADTHAYIRNLAHWLAPLERESD